MMHKRNKIFFQNTMSCWFVIVHSLLIFRLTFWRLFKNYIGFEHDYWWPLVLVFYFVGGVGWGGVGGVYDTFWRGPFLCLGRQVAV